METDSLFSRTELMLGPETMRRLAATRVALFGTGGVGSWCAEALVRTGVGRLMLVDSDRVAPSNVNRQLMATTRTLGEPKVEVLAERLRAINPEADLDVRRAVYEEATAASFRLEEFDYVIDAIDSLAEKAALIRHALSIPSVTLFASMGAALKMDPALVRTGRFGKVEGDGLARALRTKFRKTGGLPARDFLCVWSPERRENRGAGGEKKTPTPHKKKKKTKKKNTKKKEEQTNAGRRSPRGARRTRLERQKSAHKRNGRTHDRPFRADARKPCRPRRRKQMHGE